MRDQVLQDRREVLRLLRGAMKRNGKRGARDAGGARRRLSSLVPLAPLVLAIALLGCASETVKVVEGTDLSVGFTIPGMEGEANFTVFNYLSGFKTTTAESNRVKLKYTTAETNDYFGVISTRVAKTVEAEIEPVVDEPEEDKEVR